jgi:hypothetical protein
MDLARRAQGGAAVVSSEQNSRDSKDASGTLPNGTVPSGSAVNHDPARWLRQTVRSYNVFNLF